MKTVSIILNAIAFIVFLTILIPILTLANALILIYDLVSYAIDELRSMPRQ